MPISICFPMLLLLIFAINVVKVKRERKEGEERGRGKRERKEGEERGRGKRRKQKQKNEYSVQIFYHTLYLLAIFSQVCYVLVNTYIQHLYVK